MSNYTRFVVVVVCLAAVAGIWAGRPLPITALDQTQPRLDQAAPVPDGRLVVEQTFVAEHNGLSSTELTAVVYPDVTAGSVLTVSLLAADGQVIAASAFSGVAHNNSLRLSFAPLPDSAGKMYTLRLTGSPANHTTVWKYTLDGYDRGTQLVNGAPVPGDLRFSTFYTYLLPDAVHDAAAGLERLAVLAIPLWLILFAPGLLLLNWLARGADWAASAWVRTGLALALSLSLLALAWLWVGVCGGRLSVWALWAAYAVAGVAVIWRWLRRWRAQPPAWPFRLSAEDVWLALILLASLITRLLAARDLAFPAWVDSPHHYTIARLLAETGRVPNNYYAVLPIDQFTYHFGFHVLAVTVSWLASLSLVDTFLLIGQLLQGLMPLAIYATVVLLTGRPRAGLWAAGIVGLVSFFPGYYLTWGRYTQLAGMLTLAPALALVWRMVAPRLGQGAQVLPLRPALGLAGVAGVALAGVLLTHYRVVAFLVVFVLVALGLGAKGGWKRIGVAAAIGGALALPWLVRLALQQVLPAVNSPASVASPPGYNAFPWDYFQSPLERGWLFVAALAAIWGLLSRDRLVWGITGWVAVVSALLNIGRGSALVNNNSWAISLFVPAAILAGWGADQWLEAASAWARQATRLAYRASGMAMCALAAGLAAYALIQGAWAQIGIVNPATVLATADDRAALDWVTRNTPADAKFLVNGWLWLNGTWATPDGGIWLWPLAGRQTTVPPADYIYQPGWAGQVDAFNVQAAKTQDWETPEALALLRQNGVTHVFIGAKGGNLKPEMFVDKPNYRLLYTNGADWIFELK